MGFAENVNSSWFTEVPFILFLNKSDLFDEKIKSVPIKAASCFSGYDGADDDREASLEYVKRVLVGKNENGNRSVFVHVTNATDKGQIEKVFNDVQTMIINWSLERAGPREWMVVDCFLLVSALLVVCLLFGCYCCCMS